MKNGILNKILATLLVITLTFANIIIIGIYAGETHAVAGELENQGTITTNSNVQFDAFFNEGENSITHSTTIKPQDESKSLALSISVNEGYLKNAIVQISGEGGEEPNFEIVSADENVQVNDGQIEINQVNKGQTVIYNFEIAAAEKESITQDYFEKINDVTLFGTYVAESGEVISVEKTIKLNFNIQDEVTPVLEQEINRYIPYSLNGKNGIVLQMLVRSSIENNKLPIKNNEITVEVPVINEILPQEINVTAQKLSASGNNIYTFTEENWEYNAEENVLKINYENVSDVKWMKKGNDEILITYVYGEEAYNSLEENEEDVIINQNINSKMTVYGSTEEVIELSNEFGQNVNEKIGSMLKYNVSSSTPEIYKGFLKIKNIYETLYNVVWETEVGCNNNVDEIVIEDEEDKFLTADNELELDSQYKSTKIKKENFDYILGEEGYIDIYSGDEHIARIRNEIEENASEEQTVTIETEETTEEVMEKTTEEVIEEATEEVAEETTEEVIEEATTEEVVEEIEKELPEDLIISIEEDEYLTIYYEENIKNIKVVTSKPKTEGTLKIEHEKAIPAVVDYSDETIKDFEKIKTAIAAHAEIGEEKINEQSKETTIDLLETETKIDIALSTNNLSTIATNEGVEMLVVLKSQEASEDLFKNPVIEIELPSYIEKIDITDYELLFTEELEVKEAEAYVNDKGNKVIRVELEGEQTLYNIDDISKGINLILIANMELDDLTPTTKGKLKVSVSNENVTKYENEKDGKAYKELDLNAIAPLGMVVLNSLSNYDDTNNTITSLSGNESVVQLDSNTSEKTATATLTVINNYEKCENVRILGRIPFEGNKDVFTNEEFGTTFTTILQSEIRAKGINSEKVKVYYSENGEATEDIELDTNGWSLEPNQNSVSYLIMLENYTMEQGTVLNFEYDILIPENLGKNQLAYSNYAVFFDNVEREQTIADCVRATKVGVKTEEAVELDVNITSNVTGETVKEGQIVEYTTTVTNTTNKPVEGILISTDIPLAGQFVKKTEEGYKVDNGINMKTEQFEKLLPGEAVTTSFSVKVGEKAYNEQIGVKSTVYANLAKEAFVSEELIYNIEEGTVNIENYVNTDTDIQVGDIVEYCVKVNNVNGIEKTNAKVTSYLPEGIEVIEVSNNGEYNKSNNTVLWDLDTLLSNQELVLTVKVKIKDLPEGDYEKTIESIAKFTCNETEEVVSNKIQNRVVKPGMNITFSSDVTPGEVKEKETIIYNLTVENTGAAEDTYTIKGNIPEGLKLGKISYYTKNMKEEYFSASDDISISLPIEAGDTLNVQFTTTVEKLDDKVESRNLDNKLFVSSEEQKEVETNTISHYVINEDYEEETVEEDNEIVETISTYRITGTAWLDSNGNGKRENDEKLLENTKVMLVNANEGVIIDTTNTNAEGKYEFKELLPGKYIVVFEYDSSLYNITVYQKEDVNNNINSDVVSIDVTSDGQTRLAGVSDTITLTNSNIYNIDMGIVFSLDFDLELDTIISKISVTNSQGTKDYEYDDTKYAKVDLISKYINTATVVIEYKIRVTNCGDIAGYATKIVDYLPEELKFSSELNPNWYLADNGYIYNSELNNTIINPGETKEITLLLTKKMTEENVGLVNNRAEIYESYNDFGVEDINSVSGNQSSTENDISGADALLTVNAGGTVYMLVTIILVAIFGIGAFILSKRVLRRVGKELK